MVTLRILSHSFQECDNPSQHSLRTYKTMALNKSSMYKQGGYVAMLNEKGLKLSTTVVINELPKLYQMKAITLSSIEDDGGELILGMSALRPDEGEEEGFSVYLGFGCDGECMLVKHLNVITTRSGDNGAVFQFEIPRPTENTRVCLSSITIVQRAHESSPPSTPKRKTENVIKECPKVKRTRLQAVKRRRKNKESTTKDEAGPSDPPKLVRQHRCICGDQE